jgi:hypothetical protein
MPVPPVRATGGGDPPAPAGPWANLAHQLADDTERSANDMFDIIARLVARTRPRRRRAADLEEIWAAANKVVQAAVTVRGMAHRLALANPAIPRPCRCGVCHHRHAYTPE